MNLKVLLQIQKKIEKNENVAEFEPKVDESSPEHEPQPSSQYIKEQAEYLLEPRNDTELKGGEKPEIKSQKSPEGTEKSQKSPEGTEKNKEGSIENIDQEGLPALDISSKLHLSSAGPAQFGKVSFIGSGEGSPKLGARRSPLKKRIDERPGITKEEEFEFKELFDLLDYNKKGVVEVQEILAVLKSNKWHEKNPMLFALISELDTPDNREGITFTQFLNAFTSDLVANTSKEHIKNLFRLLDEDNSGTIKIDDLKRIVKEVGETVSSEELKEMLKQVGSGDEITFEEFYAVMSRKFT